MNPSLPQPQIPCPILLFARLLLALTAACLLTEILAQHLLHLAYPYNWPLMPRGDFFRDFHLYRTRFTLFHTPQFFTFDGPPYLYPAPPALFYRLFYLFPRSTVTFLLAYLATVLLAALLFVRALRARHLSPSNAVGLTALVLLCSYPLAFEYEQANLEWIVCLFVTGGIFAFLKHRGYTAAACFGIAAAMKIYPILFVGLFLSRKQYRHAIAALLACALTTLVSLWMVGPTLSLAWHGIEHGVALFRGLYMLRYEAVGFDHSCFALIKAAFTLAANSSRPGAEVLNRLLALYLSAAALAGTVLYFTLIRRLPIINQVLAFTIASILLPPVSYDYTLIHLYAPWALLILFALEARNRITPGLSAALLCFALLLAPESELILRGQTYGGQIKALTLLALLGLTLRHRFPSSFDAPTSSNPNPAT